MRYFILLFLAVALSLPAVAGTISTSASHDRSGGKQWALFSGKHAKKAKKAPKAKRSKKAGKRQRRVKSSH